MTPENVQTFSSVDLPLDSPPRATPFDDLASVVELYQPRVFRFLLATLRDRDAAETLTQETFLRAWSARSSFRSDCSISTWLIRIALNLARDHTRTLRFRFWKQIANTSVAASDVASSLPAGVASSESRMIASEQVELVWDAVACLSPRQRTVFMLRFLEEMEIPEIAAVTGLPLSTVKSHLYRALSAVRERHAQLSSARPTPRRGPQ